MLNSPSKPLCSSQPLPASVLTCAVLCLVTQSCPTPCDPTDYSPLGSSVPWGVSRQEYWSRLPCPPLGDLPNPEIKPRSPILQADSLPSELPGKPENTGVDSLFLLQGNFLTWESNWKLLHCKQILYQLSYLGSPFPLIYLSISSP